MLNERIVFARFDDLFIRPNDWPFPKWPFMDWPPILY